MQDKKLTKNIYYLVLVQFANYIAPLLVLPYLGRTLGLEGFGIVAMAISLCSIALIINDNHLNGKTIKIQNIKITINLLRAVLC